MDEVAQEETGMEGGRGDGEMRGKREKQQAGKRAREIICMISSRLYNQSKMHYPRLRIARATPRTPAALF